jgi:hypothetical protein
VELRAAPGAMLPEAGPYAGRRLVADRAGDWHFLVEQVYRESPDNIRPAVAGVNFLPPKGPGILIANQVKQDPPTNGERSIFYKLSQISAPGDYSRRIGPFPIQPDKPTPGGPWRRLEIQSQAEKLSFTWDGGALHNVPARIHKDWLKNFVQKVFPGKDDPPPKEWNPRGGIGLLIKGGSVVIRSAMIGPASGP